MKMQAKCKKNPKATKIIKNLCVFQSGHILDPMTPYTWDAEEKEKVQENKPEVGSKKQIPNQDRGNFIPGPVYYQRGGTRSITTFKNSSDRIGEISQPLHSIIEAETKQQEETNRGDFVQKVPDKLVEALGYSSNSRTPAPSNLLHSSLISHSTISPSKKMKWHIDAEVMMKKPQFKEVIDLLLGTKRFNDDTEVGNRTKLISSLTTMTSYFELVVQRLFSDNKMRFIKMMNNGYIKAILSEERTRDKEMNKKDKLQDESSKQTPVE